MLIGVDFRLAKLGIPTALWSIIEISFIATLKAAAVIQKQTIPSRIKGTKKKNEYRKCIP